MPKRPQIFVSYSRKDSRIASLLEAQLKKRRLRVWRDERSILGGELWSEAIERGIRESSGVAVLITDASAGSAWVAYEYAFANGARIPIVAVSVGGAPLPAPVARFQAVPYAGAAGTAKKIDAGLARQSRSVGQQKASSPKLIAKFREEDGELSPSTGGKIPEWQMEMWVNGVPPQTKSVTFEILDANVTDPKWTVRRPKKRSDTREFLTEEMSLWGDVEIWARGTGDAAGAWQINTRLYEALARYYAIAPMTPEIRRALKQIRTN